MRTVWRGVRNVFRNRVRASLVTLILGVSVATFLTLVQAGAGTQAEARRLREDAYTLIQVNPVGQSGVVGPRRGLPEDLADRIARIPNVVQVESYLRRQFQDNSKARQFQMGVMIGVAPGATPRLTSMGSLLSSPALLEGRFLQPEDRGKAVAAVGKVFAEQNGLGIGSEFTVASQLLRGRGAGQLSGPIQDVRVRVVGIFTTGTTWGDNQVFVPLELLQAALGRPGEVSQFWVKVDRTENVPRVEQALNTILPGSLDILSFIPQAQAVTRSLDALQANTTLGTGIALVVGALVILLTMVLVTRERRREIGVLKAIGASNADVARQFLAESVILALMGGIVGIVFHALAGSAVATLVVGAAGPAVAVNPSPAPVMFAYALTVCLVFGALGSVYPVRQAIRMSPAEAIRSA
jgi:putative ABC transport system permease protein